MMAAVPQFSQKPRKAMVGPLLCLCPRPWSVVLVAQWCACVGLQYLYLFPEVVGLFFFVVWMIRGRWVVRLVEAGILATRPWRGSV
jgi:hypothetical protein